MRNLGINQDRLWVSLMEMARIGATDRGGVNRQALTDLDRDGRDLFVSWCEAQSCTVRVDRMGNIFARRAGADDSLAPVMTGSHLDTQPTGGKYDGVYGVLAGLEVLRTLDDMDHRTRRAIEVVVWTNEEGCRFAPAMAGSSAYVGKVTLEQAHAIVDLDGKSVGEELERIGYLGEFPLGGRDIAAFFEAHIEQGPILEAEEKTIGIVRGAQGQRWFDVRVTGQEAHAGPTPMAIRKDALVGASRMVELVNRIGHEYQPGACATVGQFVVSPNSRNTIPGRVEFSVDIRHPADTRLSEMKARLEADAGRIAADIGLELVVEEIWYQPPIRFDPDCVRAVARAAEASGLSAMEITSGAGHDACNISEVAPTAMIFVPCEGGISHNEAEEATAEDLAAGCDVLLGAILERADAP